MVEGSRASRSSRAVAPLAPVAGAVALLLAACGSRGPLDLGPGVVEVQDASADALVDSSTDDASDAADTAPPAKDAAKDAPGEASLIDCGSCVATTCGQDIVACLTDTACRTVLTCVAQTCLGGGGGGGGGFDPQCIFTCANGDTAAIGQLVGIFTCITQKCGPDCGSVLGGLGGLGGGFPGGNSPVPNPGQ